jgi:hypothetical protein
MPTFFDERRPHEGLTYQAYRSDWKHQAEAPMDGKDASERKMAYYLRYNWERQQQVHAAYDPSDALRDALASLQAPQLWMVLTEPWCGDSAFLLPVIADAAAASEAVTLRILLRDDNLDIMDQYLTDGSRSIPKLVTFTEDGHEQFTWGPRPAGAAARYARLKKEKDTKEEVIEALVEYYEEGGWKETEEELIEQIRQSTVAPA